MNIDLTEISVILGQKNSVKSVLLEHLLTQTERFLCLDPNHEHGPPGSTVVRSPTDVLRQWMNGHTRQVVRDAPLTEEKAEQYMRAFGQLQGTYLVVDEAHNYRLLTGDGDLDKDRPGLVKRVRRVEERVDELAATATRTDGGDDDDESP